MSNSKNFPVRFLSYLEERFPPYQMLPLVLVLGLSCSMIAQFISRPKSFAAVPCVISFVSLLLFLFRLRIFDEFKDFDHDKQFYPDRPVPRGLVTLSELQKVGFVVVGLELALSLYKGTASILLYLIALGYSLLMLKEFFVREWLRKHFTIYVLSHEILTIPLFYYIYSLNFSNFTEISNPVLFIHAIFQTAILFSLEVTRKIRPKALEIASGDTYTARYGILGAAVLLIFLATVALVSKSFITKLLFFPDLLFFTLFFASVINFVRQPTKTSSKAVLLAAAVFAFSVNLSFIFSLWGRL